MTMSRLRSLCTGRRAISSSDTIRDASLPPTPARRVGHLPRRIYRDRLTTFTLIIVQHARTDVPINQVVFEEDGQYFYRPTGSERPKHSLSLERYAQYRRYEQQVRRCGLVTVVLFFGVVALSIALFDNRRG